MTTTARSIVRLALTDLGVVSPEQPMAAEMVEHGLDLLNELLDSLSLDHVLIYYVAPLVVPWPAGVQQVTWGLPGGDIAHERPLRLRPYATYAYSDGTDLPLAVLTRQEDYVAITLTHLASRELQCLYYAPSMPLGTLYGYPVPTADWAVTVFPWVPLGQFPALDDELELPPGYARLLRTNLALEVAPSYGVQPAQTLVRMAWESRTAVVPLNAQVGRLSMTPGATGGGNHLTRFRAGGP